MTIELRPLGVRCNIACQYCYQTPQRDAGNVAHQYDITKMKAAIIEEGGPFSMFGGEPLLVPEKDLEDLWSWGYQKWGRNGIQTNGTLINANHVRLFKQYKVSVGISIDGPGELNDARWAGTLERTRAQTEASERAIDLLCEEGIPPSLIVTLHRGNATEDKLPTMHEWFRQLDRKGVCAARLHVLEVENELMRAKYALSTEENIRAFKSFARLEKELSYLKFDLFKDMKQLLMGRDGSATCVWRACDPYTTSAVRGVEGFGQRSNCGRTNKEGVDFRKAETPGFERYVALYHIPQEHGGCKGCRFFLMCKGQCPGTAIGGDWRNRTEHCELWKELYRLLEDECLDSGVAPLTAQPALRQSIEQEMLAAWTCGRNTTIQDTWRAIDKTLQAAIQPHGTQSRAQTHGHGDHTDAHGDSGHGDSHGDHTDHGDSW